MEESAIQAKLRKSFRFDRFNSFRNVLAVQFPFHACGYGFNVVEVQICGWRGVFVKFRPWGAKRPSRRVFLLRVKRLESAADFTVLYGQSFPDCCWRVGGWRGITFEKFTAAEVSPKMRRLGVLRMGHGRGLSQFIAASSPLLNAHAAVEQRDAKVAGH